MNLPILIFAEAAVKSKRADYKSILDPDPQLDSVGFKTFYSDPDLIAEAVKRLKLAGFTVTSVNRTGVGIMGTVARFERTFGVKLVGKEIGKTPSARPLISVTCETSERYGYIDTSKTANLNEVLSGISLSQPIVYSNPVPAMPDDSYKTGNRLRLADLWEQLNGDQIIGEPPNVKQIERALNNGEGMEVIIVDSGCYKNHTFFQKMGVANKINVIVNFGFAKLVNSNLQGMKAKLEELEKEQAIKLATPKNNPGSKAVDADDELFLSLLGELEAESNNQQPLAKLKKEIAEIESYSDESRDVNGHGTAMVASVLAIAPMVQVTVIKITMDILGASFWYGIDEMTKGHQKVISCSFGGQSRTDIPGKRKVEEIAGRALLLFPTGNFDNTSNIPKEANAEAYINGALSIGGAYRETERLFASDTAYAEIGDTISSYPSNKKKRRIPDICGWCGPNDDGRLMVPIESLSGNNRRGGMPNEWQLTNGGTSSATAQIAGVIALIKQVWPGATREEILATLTTTADEIGRKTFADNVKPYDLGPVGYGIGIANIAKIIATARKASASKQATSDLKKDYVNALLKIFKERQSKINAFIKQY